MREWAVFLALGMVAACGFKPEASPSAEKAAKPPRADLMEVPEELKNSATTAVNQGYIDFVNELGAAESTEKQRTFSAKSDQPLWIRGWAYDDTAKKTPNRVWIELTGKASGLRFFLPADRMERPDVATGFKIPWARGCGMATPVVKDHNIPPGAYDLKIYQIDGKTVETTRFYNVDFVTLIFE